MKDVLRRTGYSFMRGSLMLTVGLLLAFGPAFAQNSKTSASAVKATKTSTSGRLGRKTSPAKRVRKDGKDDQAAQDGKIEISIGKPVRPASMDRDLRTLPQIGPSEKEKNEAEEIERIAPQPKGKKPMSDAIEVSNVQAEQPSIVLSPPPSVSFDGLDFASFGAGWPPDTVGDVGPNHYIQAVNTAVGIYNKTGTQLAAFTFNTLWTGAGSGTVCDNTNRGDPTVIYDPQFNRWIVADFAFTGSGNTVPFFECIAVSKTSDPVSGGWWLYAMRGDDASHPWFPDYPKMGIWRDGLYMTTNMFLGNTFQEARVWAFRLTDLVGGGPVANRVIDTNSAARFSMLPAHYHGTLPPAGTDEFVVAESASLFAFEVWRFHVDFVGAGTTFTGPTNVSQNAYSAPTATVASSANNLDTVQGDFLKMQLQYRNIASVESLWVTHGVRTGAATANGIQWAQVNVTGGTIITTPVQQQIYGNLSGDGIDRIMGSIGIDRLGDVALGYSTTKAAVNPGISYNGRLVADALNSLPQGEALIQTGGGSQSGNCGGSPCIRWGDYSAMSVDPIDDCTFWYTQEYYSVTGLNWKTRVAAFKFAGCLAPTAANVTVAGRAVMADGRGISGVMLTMADSNGIQRTAKTNSFGFYQFDGIPAGQSYILSANTRRYQFAGNPRVVEVRDDIADLDFVASP